MTGRYRVAEDGGLGALDAEEALEITHGAALVDALNLQVSPVRAGNRVLVGVGEVRQGGLRERLNRADDVDRELDDRVIDLAGSIASMMAIWSSTRFVR